MGAFWLGSTARHLVHHAPCPVVVIRGAASRGRPDRVVVGVDGSSASDRALRWAADEADLHQIELSIVHGWWYPYETRTNAAEQARDLTRIDAAGVLEEAERLARDCCGAEVTGQLVEGSPPSAILDSLRDGDLLVMGSRGRGAVRSGLFGSTVYNVLDHSAVPVVVVRGVEDRRGDQHRRRSVRALVPPPWFVPASLRSASGDSRGCAAATSPLALAGGG